MAAMQGASVVGGGRSWKWRAKHFVGSHLRQVPCLDACVQVVPKTLRFWRRRKYQTLGQGEQDDGTEVEDKRQSINHAFGGLVIKVAMLCMIGVTVLTMVQNSKYEEQAKDRLPEEMGAEPSDEEFRRDAPLVLYLGALELLICGACAQTASNLYTRRRHALKHPQDCEGERMQRYVKVELSKDASQQDRQLYGLVFRSSTDGLECLVVEQVQPNSLLDLWNRKCNRENAQQILQAALGGSAAAGLDGAPGGGVAPAMPVQPRVLPGAAVVAINHVFADVGMMQLELSKPSVTLWVRSEIFHPSLLESEVLADDDETPAPAPGQASDSGPPAIAPPGAPAVDGVVVDGSVPGPIFFGKPCEDESPSGGSTFNAADAIAGPRCASLAFEDEEPQILMRWLICSVLFGWVTMLPVLLMQPHESRPRQHLFRQYLLKPCLFLMPLWLLAWLLDCVELFFEANIMSPFFYFSVVHMLMPAVLVWYLLKLQAADQQLVLDQRKARQAEAAKDSSALQPVAVEDPAPTLLKEFICMNPVALVIIGSVAAIPIVISSLLTPMKTERARMAQGFLNMVYGPQIFLQLAFMWVLTNVKFVDLPRFYVACFGFLLSVPCFVVWCICLTCASRYGRQDMLLAQGQRIQRGRALVVTEKQAGDEESGSAGPEQEMPASSVVDTVEVMHREWELCYSA